MHYGQQEDDLNLLVVKGNDPSLLSCDWLAKIKLDWQSIHKLHHQDSTLEEALEAHSDLFSPGLETIPGTTAKLHVDPAAKPRFCRPRSVPHALRSRVAEALDKLEEEGIIEPVDFSEWAAPIVSVVKRDGSICICGDYKLTINQAAEVDTYPLPLVEDIFASFAGGKVF